MRFCARFARFQGDWKAARAAAMDVGMTSFAFKLVPPVFACLALAACATPSSGAYPSLAVRDGERMTGEIAVPDTPAFVPAPPTPATLDRLDSLAAAARQAHARFVAAIGPARGPVEASRGAAVGSERWSVAQVALADLESHRSEAMIALADLDRLYVDAATGGSELAQIADVRDAIAALVEEEDRQIARLLGTIGS